MSNINPELSAKLQEVASTEKALLLSFIAPDSIIRTSPASIAYAKIKATDLYEIEKKIEEVRKENGKLPKKLHIIIHTPGGELYASTKIAMYLQKIFGSKIQAFVPYEAASGGTILCLAAKSIVMDAASNLTPIDPQVPYNNKRISATSYEQAIKDFKKECGNLRPEELSSPYPQMANHFDPIIAKEMDRIAVDMLNVAYKLLKVSQEPKTPAQRSNLMSTAFFLGNSDSPHSHVISADEAKQFGLNIDSSSQSLTLLRLYKEWVSDRLNEKKASHVVEVYYPKSTAEDQDTETSSGQEGETNEQANETAQ